MTDAGGPGREHAPEDASDAPDGTSLVVCMLACASEAAGSIQARCLSVPGAVPVLLGIDADSNPAASSIAAENVEGIALSDSDSLAYVANRAARRWPRADLVLVLPGAEPRGAWLDRLRAAAAAESTTATVSALASEVLPPGARAVAEGRGNPADVNVSPAELLAQASGQARPRLAWTMPSCVYVRRATLDLIGPFDEELRCSQAAVLDFALRARRRGLANLLADDVLVRTAAVELPDEDSRTLTMRYPALVEAAAQPPSAALERTIALAAVSLERMEVTFDARALGPETAGTQVYLLGLLEALAADGRSSLRVLVGPTLQDAAQRRLESLPRVELMSYEQALTTQRISHVVHRPQQVFSPEDLLLLRPLGRRLVITHHDLIAYHNPMYFGDSELWQRYVRTTRQSLAAADQVIFFSRHALEDSLREDLVDPARADVVHLGVDPATQESRDGSRGESIPTMPRSLQGFGQRPFLLCLGADYLHKNRPFALALLDELRRAHGWDGAIVLAGSHVEHGSSKADEQEVRAQRSIRVDDVLEISALSEAERVWLMQRTSAVVYPTVQEGFGLLPFEAAHFGVPCLFAAQSSLAELFEQGLATIVPWDAARTAARAIPLLHDGPERERHVAGLRRAAGALRWSDCAQGTVEAYRKALEAPYRASGEEAWQALQREQEIVRLDRGAKELGSRLRQLSDDLGEDALALVGERALLSSSDQHLVLAVAARPALKRLVFGALRSGFRVMHARSKTRR